MLKRIRLCSMPALALTACIAASLAATIAIGQEIPVAADGERPPAEAEVSGEPLETTDTPSASTGTTPTTDSKSQAEPLDVDAAPSAPEEDEPAADSVEQTVSQEPEVLDEATQIAGIFERYIDSLGGERALKKIESRSIRGTMESRGKTVEFESFQLEDGRFGLIQHFPQGDRRLGFDGTNTWRQTSGKPWESLSGAEALVQQRDHHLQSALLWRESFTELKRMPDGSVHGRPCHTILATLPTGATRTLFFDQKTDRLVRVEYSEDSTDESTAGAQLTIKDYRAQDDVVIPFTTEMRSKGLLTTSRILKVRHNQPIDINELTPPAANVAVGGIRDSERYFERLTIGELTITNVWVHRQTNYNVLIRHAGGIQTIKLTDLPKDDLEALRPQLGDLANMDEGGRFAFLGRLDELEMSEDQKSAIATYRAQIEESALLLAWPFVALILLLHVVSSVFTLGICRQTGTKSRWEAWVPLLNQSLLMRAAKMSGAWPLLGLLGYLAVGYLATNQLIQPTDPLGLVVVLSASVFMLITSIMWLVWSFKIWPAREKSAWMGVLLLIPGVNLFAFAYLAFGK